MAADAKVSVNDAILSPETLKSPVKLAAGEYRIVAEAPGHARQEKMVTVVSGQKDQPVVLTLSTLSGILVVRAHDSQAAIAVDGARAQYARAKAENERYQASGRRSSTFSRAQIEEIETALAVAEAALRQAEFEYDRRVTDWELKRGFERS